MAKSINKVQILGNVGKIEAIPTRGTSVTKMSVATSFAFKNKKTEEWEEETEWHQVTLFGSLADVAEKYIKKGHKVFIEGSLQTSKYEDREGVTRWSTQINARELVLLTPKEGGEETKAEYKKTNTSNDSQHYKNENDFVDDEIPF